MQTLLSIRTTARVLGNLDEFAYLGGFSSIGGRGGIDPKTSDNGAPAPPTNG